MLTLDKTYAFRGQKVAWGAIGDGPPIVLVHGFPWSAQAWRNIAPWLAMNRRVYYFDMVGTGQSEKFDGQDVRECVQSDLLAELISHWSLDRPMIVGHDFGGLAVLRAHFVNGVQYGRLVLFNAVAIMPTGYPFYVHVHKHEAAFAGLPPYAHEALFAAYTQNAASTPMTAEARRIYAKPYIGETGQSAFYRQIAQADTQFIVEAEERYAPPAFDVNIAWGEEDTFIPIERGRKLAELLGAQSFTPIPKAAHIVQEDAPEALVAVMMSV